MTSRTRRQFTPEFKAEAVALVEASGGNIAQVAKELKLYDSTLGNWVREARAEAAGAPTVQERAEIRGLRRELDRVTRERDLLAKAVAFFSAPTRNRVDGALLVRRRGEGRPPVPVGVAEMCRVLEVSRSGF